MFVYSLFLQNPKVEERERSKFGTIALKIDPLSRFYLHVPKCLYRYVCA